MHQIYFRPELRSIRTGPAEELTTLPLQAQTP